VAIQSGSSPDVATEQELVEQAKRGDTSAFAELVNRYERNIYRLARHITQNEDDAEDVLQETFLKAFANLDQFQGHSKFYTWLVRIAVNESLMKLRRRKADRSVSLDEPVETGEDSMPREIAAWEENPEQKYGRAEMNAILSRAIDSLSPGFRTVFLLRDVEGFSTEETASALKLSIPAVKSRLLRARLQLREKLNRIFRKHGNITPVHL
jgi:RNA polymerase sigma-70 factor (ECF subfamily)